MSSTVLEAGESKGMVLASVWHLIRAGTLCSEQNKFAVVVICLLHVKPLVESEGPHPHDLIWS